MFMLQPVSTYTHEMVSILFLIISLFDKSYSIELLLSVEENTKTSNPIGNLQAMIKNQTKIVLFFDFQSIIYTGVNSESFGTKNLLKVDSKNGDIRLQSPLDREEICQSLNNCHGSTVIEYVINVNSTLFELKIEIIDVNDNSPSFNPDEKQIEIPEGIAKNTDISLPVAKDRDSERFGVKNYTLQSISNGDWVNYFSLYQNPITKNPYLRVVAELDREFRDNFEFNLFATDGGGNQGKCKINVKITDINDNTPQWTGLPYRLQIRECTTENKVKRLMAEDRDDPLTEGGQIRYKFSENSRNFDLISRIFYITDDTLYLNNGALRSKTQGNLSVYVVAKDGGGRSNETTVDIEITDCNDHAPSIQIETPMPSVVENDQTEKSLTKITVKDNDYGVNSEFSCNLNDTTHLILKSVYATDKNRLKIFELRTQSDSGFDRERTPRHSVEINCADNGQPVMSSSSIITIYILDQNDNKPKFEVEFKIFSIAENARIGSDVGIVTAADNDASPNNVISYYIVGDELTNNTFSVTNTGQIQLLLNIDRETIDRYEFKVVAIDNGKPSLNDSCQVKVLVLDINDCKPEIAKEHHFSIVESYGMETKHQNLGKLNATDRDNGYNGTLTFRFKSNSHNSNPLRLLSDGRLSIYGIIDREKNERIEAEILVSDGGHPAQISSTTVIVEVLDLNDNKPKFTFPSALYNNFLNVSLDQSVGSIIGQLKATDRDKDSNGTVVFGILGNDPLKKTFIVHPDGQIMLNEDLKSNPKTKYTLLVEVRDQGSPSLSEIATLYIRDLTPRIDSGDNKRNNFPPRINENKNGQQAQKNGTIGWSNVMMLIYFLAAAVFLAIVGIGGTFLYLWCRGFSDKHVTARESISSNYNKNSSKSDKNQHQKSNLEIKNQFMTSRNENSYQIVDPQCQIVNYSSLLKNYSGAPVDQPYQFRSLVHGGGSYSAFQPRPSSPTIDKDNQEFSHFNNDEIWEHPQQPNTIDNRNLCDGADNVYSTHKYNVATPVNFENNHFTTPNQSRRSDVIQLKNDTSYKAKVNYVASSFV